MCEYCGCQAVTVIAELTREHERALDAVRAAEQAAIAGDLGAARAALLDLEAVLGPHTVVEEQGLFPAMARDFPDQVHVLELEHRAIEELCAAVQSQQPPELWSAEVIETMAVLRTHILKEQDGVFPAALSLLTTADWQAVEDARTKAGAPQ